MTFPAFVPIGIVPPRSTGKQSALAKALAQKASAAAPVSAAKTKVRRQDFTDRLGLPTDATDDQVLAAVDAAKARRTKPRQPASPQSADDAAYERFFGAAKTAEDRLYDSMFGAAKTAEDRLYDSMFGA